MKQSFKVLAHFGIWLAYALFVILLAFTFSQSQEIEPDSYGYYASFVIGVGIIPPVFSFYSHYVYLFPNYLQKRKVGLSILVSIAISSLATLLGFVFVWLVSDEVYNCVVTGLPYASSFTFGLSTFFGVLALVLKGFLTWFEELKLKEDLIEKTHRMELALVKSQLDPHFLFNTINNIDVLISKKPEEASKYLNRLSDIMRFMLYETKSEEIPLSKELEYIEKYIQLQRIRTANDNYVRYEVSGEATAKKVAPMVFIPFIENAFKHSTNKKIDQAIDIGIQIEDEAIVFKCQNKIEAILSTPNGQNGLGNELIKKRLDLLYPNRHSLKVDRQANQYTVELRIANGQV